MLTALQLDFADRMAGWDFRVCSLTEAKVPSIDYHWFPNLNGLEAIIRSDLQP
jgi:hypothetical protein